MAQQRSGAVTAIAVLHLIGGGLGLIASLCGGVGLMMSPSGGAGAGSDPQAFMKQNVPGYMAVTVGQLLVGLLLDVLLLSAGIGLLSRQPWARVASIVYACISIPFKIFGLVWQFVYINPAMNKLFEGNTALPPGFKQGVQFGQYMALAFGLLFMIYPIAVLWVMLLPATKREFAPGGGRRRGRDDNDDDRENYHDRAPSRGRSGRDDDDEDDDRRRGRDDDRPRRDRDDEDDDRPRRGRDDDRYR